MVLTQTLSTSMFQLQRKPFLSLAEDHEIVTTAGNNMNASIGYNNVSGIIKNEKIAIPNDQ